MTNNFERTNIPEDLIFRIKVNPLPFIGQPPGCIVFERVRATDAGRHLKLKSRSHSDMEELARRMSKLGWYGPLTISLPPVKKGKGSMKATKVFQREVTPGEK